MIREKIIKALQEITGQQNVDLEVPEVSEHGDYSTNVAMVMFGNRDEILRQDQGDKSDLRILFDFSNTKSPRELAEKIREKILKQVKDDGSDWLERIEVAGPGFINFYLSKKVLVRCITDIHKDADRYGYSDLGKGRTVIVEYSSPNIAKPFTVGHLRSTVIGDAIANLYEAIGWTVLRDNHLGDWGTQFGKQVYAIKNLGEGTKEKNIEKINNSENPVRELVALYVEFHQKAEEDTSLEEKAREWFKKLEEGDSEARDIWQMCIDWSWKEFERIYNLLGVSFSKEFNGGKGLGESFFEDKMRSVVEELQTKKLLKEGEGGAKLVFFDNEKYPPAMILKSDGTTLYHTRDLATDKYRKEKYNPDMIINEVGSEQILYFRQLYEIEETLGWFTKGQRVHVAHGLVRFKDKKMSTRKGNVVWLEEILKRAGEKATEKMEKAKKHSKNIGTDETQLGMDIGVGAIKYNDLKRDPKSEIIFDWDEILNMEGNSGPYLQYTYARTRSVLRKLQVTGDKLKERFFAIAQNDGGDELSINDKESALIRAFIHFPEVVQSAAENYSPNLLCNYLYDLAQRYNTFYNAHRIINADDEKVRVFRIALSEAAGQILKNGLNLLGIKAPERM
ncbi:arginine--tRNA ligase, partial [Candidatus Woesebacteria bacterium]|nr:arginine--tRNA ligase [Candidatus Woesebacteria bacterium]